MAWLKLALKPTALTRISCEITRGLQIQRFSTSSCVYSKWNSKDVRSTFIEYFKENDHRYVPSSSVRPKKGDGTYFVNAGMNQFKPIFLGTVDPESEQASYRRVTNSQKCIRVGGKHNDLDDVGRDTYHHTFFEMLGSWSFGKYFKKEACNMAWELVTQVYKLPLDRLYVTYFAGDKSQGLPADEECRDIWLQLGLNPERVLPFFSKDNFWDMGLTGPCGPCTEIHYNHTDTQNVAHLVNAGDPLVLELWNLVFMQYDRQEDQSLVPLAANHVDTGMGLERLTAVLQKQISNYDTDLFTPYFKEIQRRCNCPAYGTNEALDVAYRIVADHCRMATVSIADGIIPGNKDLDSRLRIVIQRAVNQSLNVLKSEPGLLGSLVPLVVASLGDAFPELKSNPSEIADVINQSEQNYIRHTEIGTKVIQKALSKYNKPNQLSSEQIWEIHEGRFGRPVSVDLIQEICGDLGVAMNIEEYEEYAEQQRRNNATHVEPDASSVQLKQHHLNKLTEDGIPPTDDSFKYNYSSFMGRYFFEAPQGEVLALICNGEFVDSVPEGEECGILLNKTLFYAESGGQYGDKGWLSTHEDCDVLISDVQKFRDYVLHVGVVESGSLRVTDDVQMAIDQRHREKCMRNHTTTHLLQYALSRELGKVQQAGSVVGPHKLVFDFTTKFTKNKVSNENLKNVADMMDKLIKKKIPVFKKTVALNDAKQVKGLTYLGDEAYPRKCRVISIGADIDEMLTYPNSDLGLEHSVELCGGTHVDNTADIGSVVITAFMSGGTKRITAVTGEAAQYAERLMQGIQWQIEELQNWIKVGYNENQWITRIDGINKSLSGDDSILPKIQRDKALSKLETMERDHISKLRNRYAKEELAKELKLMTNSVEQNAALIGKMDFQISRDMADVLAVASPSCPVMLFSESADKSNVVALCYVPEGDERKHFSAQTWADHLAKCIEGDVLLMKGKRPRKKNIHMIKWRADKENDMEKAIKESGIFLKP